MTDLLEQLAKEWERDAGTTCAAGCDRCRSRRAKHLATAAALRELKAARHVIEFHLDPSNEEVGEYDTTTCATDSLLTQAFTEAG